MSLRGAFGQLLRHCHVYLRALRWRYTRGRLWLRHFFKLVKHLSVVFVVAPILGPRILVLVAPTLCWSLNGRWLYLGHYEVLARRVCVRSLLLRLKPDRVYARHVEVNVLRLHEAKSLFKV